ncbi:SDR family oxidoreductase [Agrobacterium vitis]|uniref:SDR family oxidoreductase n=1 Tax=Agrobacterium vitis TaxID=373 RepID=UPI0015749FE8|nr:SDR family oxidoreductase [Agrobacterium vitis]NSZ17152.1 SDR family oxidoreductase [Agrobacterium vitis]QZO02881.1 SDR family oxidoreductase [Agrobacterium vitis]UJL88006.1 SDR family oxidoreductase [Agrobacterium vitis]
MTAISKDMALTPSAGPCLSYPLHGLHVIVTGGSGGIGGGIARALVSAGAKVAILSRNPPEKWHEPPPLDWPCANWISCDLNDLVGTKLALTKYLDEAPPPDVLVHSAVDYGVGGRKSFEQTVFDEWLQMFNVNVHAPFLLTSVMLPYLKGRPKALVLFISSEVVFNAGPHRVAYAATKSALHGTMSGLAKEVEGTGLSVVGVLPEMMIDTPGIRRRRPEGFDYSGYSEPSDFANSTMALIARLGAGDNGKSLIVRASGDLVQVGDFSAPSQSRPLADDRTAAGVGK